MKELIKQTQQAWVKAKKDAENLCRSENNQDLAKKLSECQMFTGDETFEEMIAKMFSARGAEFLTRFAFPSLYIFRQFKPFKPELHGIFIDMGKLDISECNRVFLVGDTEANICFTKTAVCHVILMHGAKASIIIDGYAVLKIESDTLSSYSVIKNGHAVIL